MNQTRLVLRSVSGPDPVDTESCGLLQMISKKSIWFVLIGGANTVFGYFSTLSIYFMLSPRVHTFIIGVIATLLNITVSFITNKLLVFRTEGRWLSEYLRSYMVYGPVGLVGATALTWLVDGLHVNVWLAQGSIMAAVAVFSYFGHSKFTFGRPAKQPR